MKKESKFRHRVKAYLYPNMLTASPNDFSARTISERSMSIADICESAVARGGAHTTAAAMEANAILFFKEMAYRLADGFSINTGYFLASTNIKGVFESPTETFNKEKHNVSFQFRQGEIMRSMIPDIEVDLLGVAETGPFIGQVFDVKTATTNDTLSPGHILKLAGSKIKITGNLSDIGIFFIALADGLKTAVSIKEVATNNPSELIFIIPALNAGDYEVEVVTQYSGGGAPLKSSRSSILNKVLTVM